MAQWRAAGPALEAVRADELRVLDEATNARIATSLPYVLRKEPECVSETGGGLAIQQSIFLKALSK